MERLKNNSKTNNIEPKKNTTNFGRIVAKLDIGKKSPVFESSFDKANAWNKKQEGPQSIK
jgi:hypothetical protein